jgi:hypothetical protein
MTAVASLSTEVIAKSVDQVVERLELLVENEGRTFEYKMK